jgi:hypothetical protein
MERPQLSPDTVALVEGALLLRRSGSRPEVVSYLWSVLDAIAVDLGGDNAANGDTGAHDCCPLCGSPDDNPACYLCSPATRTTYTHTGTDPNRDDTGAHDRPALRWADLHG